MGWLGFKIASSSVPVLGHGTTIVTPTPTPSPAFTVAPSITGTPRVGNALSSLTYNDGTITNGTVSTRTILLGGVAKLASYVLVDADLGAALTYRVYATGAGGSATATSASATVQAALSGETLDAPTLTKTSTDPDQLNFDVTFLSEYAGKYLHFQLATEDDFVPDSPSTIVFTGDSWVNPYAGYYAGHYAATYPSLDIDNQSIGGTGFAGLNGIIAREAQVIAARPRVYHLGTGRNDLSDDWFETLEAHIQRIKDGCMARWGYAPLVSVETLTALQVAGQTASNAAFNARRATINPLIRASALIDAVVDFAANSSLGDDADMIPAAASSSTISVDGTHLFSDDNWGHSTGHAIAYPIFAAAINSLVAAAPVVPGDMIGETTVFITSDVINDGPDLVDFLADQPAGDVHARARIEDDEPNESEWSNTISGTVAAAVSPVTWNPADKYAAITLSNGNLTATFTNDTATQGVRSTQSRAIGATAAASISIDNIVSGGSTNFYFGPCYAAASLSLVPANGCQVAAGTWGWEVHVGGSVVAFNYSGLSNFGGLKYEMAGGQVQFYVLSVVSTVLAWRAVGTPQTIPAGTGDLFAQANVTSGGTVTADFGSF